MGFLNEVLRPHQHWWDSDAMQRHDIDALRDRVHDERRRQVVARGREQALEARVAELEEQVGEATLLCRTLLHLLVENDLMNPERFYEVLASIDAEDGVQDGMVTPKRSRSSGRERGQDGGRRGKR